MAIQDNPAPLSRPLAAFIIAGNAVPLLGVMLWEWNVFALMYLYWVENIAAGLLTLPLLVAAGAREGKKGLLHGLGGAGFFTIHYGLFCMAHGLFILDIFNPGGLAETGGHGLFAALRFFFHGEPWDGFYWALAGIILAQTVQTARRWPAHSHKEIGKVMMLPYPRMLMLHVTIIFGGMLVQALGQPAAALIVLIALKTAFDLGLGRAIMKGKKKNDAGRNLNT